MSVGHFGITAKFTATKLQKFKRIESLIDNNLCLCLRACANVPTWRELRRDI